MKKHDPRKADLEALVQHAVTAFGYVQSVIVPPKTYIGGPHIRFTKRIDDMETAMNEFLQAVRNANEREEIRKREKAKKKGKRK